MDSPEISKDTSKPLCALVDIRPRGRCCEAAVQPGARRGVAGAEVASVRLPRRGPCTPPGGLGAGAQVRWDGGPGRGAQADGGGATPRATERAWEGGRWPESGRRAAVGRTDIGGHPGPRGSRWPAEGPHTGGKPDTLEARGLLVGKDRVPTSTDRLQTRGKWGRQSLTNTQIDRNQGPRYGAGGDLTFALPHTRSSATAQ